MDASRVQVIDLDPPRDSTRAGQAASRLIDTAPVSSDAARGRTTGAASTIDLRPTEHAPTEHAPIPTTADPRPIDPDPLRTREHACRVMLAGVVDSADTITGAAQRALSTRYNEVAIGAHRVDADRVRVVFHACRGAETSRGVRMVDITRTLVGPRDAVWSLDVETFMPMPGELQSRKGTPATSTVLANISV